MLIRRSYSSSTSGAYRNDRLRRLRGGARVDGAVPDAREHRLLVSERHKSGAEWKVYPHICHISGREKDAVGPKISG